MSEEMIGTVVLASRELENLLEQLFGAVGKGLHSKTDSVEDKLPMDTVKRLRFIASIRNRVVHEHNYELSDIYSFKQTVESTLAELRSISCTPNITPEFIHEIIEECNEQETNKSNGIPRSEENRSLFLYLVLFIGIFVLMKFIEYS